MIQVVIRANTLIFGKTGKTTFSMLCLSGLSLVGQGAVCSGDCVFYNGTNYAALVIFSGLKQGTQSRYAPPFEAIDEKLNVNNYLEEGRAGVFPDNAGNKVYPVVTAASNDVVFCIATNMSVVAC